MRAARKGRGRSRNGGLPHVSRFTFHAGATRIIALLVFVCFCTGCGSHHGSFPSPDHSMTLVTYSSQFRDDPGGYHCVVIEIRDRRGWLLHKENTGVSDQRRWSVRWRSNDRIEVKGTGMKRCVWQCQPNGAWKKLE